MEVLEEMDDHIITIGDSNGFDGWKWKMTVDLKELAEATGRKTAQAGRASPTIRRETEKTRRKSPPA